MLKMGIVVRAVSLGQMHFYQK
jgi:hypothetical protein